MTGLEENRFIEMTTDYEKMFQEAQLDQTKLIEIENVAFDIRLNQTRYQTVASQVQMPWYVIAAIHNLEASLDFHCHLHNGDPLSNRTIHIPKGRPISMPYSGEMPYTWEQSAIDALADSGLWIPSKASNWTIAQCLEFMERYNGFGYMERNINTPYLWSYTNMYQKGLFVSDGIFNPDTTSQEIGAVALFKVMENKGYIVLEY